MVAKFGSADDNSIFTKILKGPSLMSLGKKEQSIWPLLREKYICKENF